MLCFLAAVASTSLLSAERRRPCLAATKGDKAFLQKPEFDLLSLREWRRETLVRYAAANQSEPLRILLFSVLGLALLFAQPIAESIGAPDPDPILAYYAGSAASFSLLNRERLRRTRRLVRLEREVRVSDLEIVLQPTPGAQQRKSLRSLRNEFRVVAVNTDAVDFEARALATRLRASRVLVVSPKGEASPVDQSEYQSIFTDLLSSDQSWEAPSEQEPTKGGWFALGFSGRSVASGVGSPDLLELLGSVYPPLDFQAPEPPISSEQVAKRFYDALLEGTANDVVDVFSATELSSAIDEASRIDDWSKQLQDGARPTGLVVGNADFLTNGDAAVSTAIELVPDVPDGTLLALQRWNMEDGEWKLVSHETVPFTPGKTAAALLRCDRRGCVAFTQGGK